MFIFPWPSLKATGEGREGDLWTFYSNKAKPIVAKPKVRTDFTSYLIDVVWDGRLWYNFTNLTNDYSRQRSATE